MAACEDGPDPKAKKAIRAQRMGTGGCTLLPRPLSREHGTLARHSTAGGHAFVRTMHAQDSAGAEPNTALQPTSGAPMRRPLATELYVRHNACQKCCHCGLC